MRVASLVFGLFLAWAAVASAGETFKNTIAGFEVTKPDSWQFLTTDEGPANPKGVKPSDQEFQAAVQKYAKAPMLVLTKYREPYQDVNPSFRVNVRPLGPYRGKSAIEAFQGILPQFEKAFKDYKVVQPPTEVKLSGLKGAYTQVEYSVETSDGQKFPTTAEMWIIPRGDYFFLIAAGTRQDEKTGTRKEIQAILKTVKIEH
jgi:hypothetical protein